MIRTFPRWLALVVATGLIAMPACSWDGSADEPSTPQVMRVVGAKVVSGTEIELVFSKPVQASAAIDPRAFRLSAGRVLKAGVPNQVIYDYGTTYGHYDKCPLPPPPTYSSGYFECQTENPTADETLYYDLGAFTKIAPGSDPTTLVATLESQLGSLYDAGMHAREYLSCGDLFLHYAEASPPVVDASGDVLAPFGAGFVASSANPLDVHADRPGGAIAVDASALGPLCSGKGCSDGFVDGVESDVDCGGGQLCKPCDNGKRCSHPYDCASGACDGGTCKPATCDDVQLNGGETDVDCGGATTCPRCDAGKVCNAASDCASNDCVLTNFGDVPQSRGQQQALGCANACSDAVQGNGESNIDCGGSCGGCVGDLCSQPSECASGVCTSGACAPTPVIALSAGGCAVTGAGDVKCWGLGGTRIANGIVPTPVAGLARRATSIGVTRASIVGTLLGAACALDEGGGVSCWGWNFRGLLGDGTQVDRFSAAPVLGLTSGVKAIAVGGSHACAVTVDGAAKCWGENSDGELGDGTRVDTNSPHVVSGLSAGVADIAANSGSTCVLTRGGGVKCWGRNSNGAAGGGTSASPQTTPIDVTGLGSGVTAIAVGYTYACALTTAGGVKCWGTNNKGQLGDGTSSARRAPVDVVGLTSGVAAIAAGDATTCAVTTAGAALCWGDNQFGQVGDGTTTRRSTPTPVAGLASGATSVSAGQSTACARTTDGRALCWGDNSQMQLGDGTTTRRKTPTPVYGF